MTGDQNKLLGIFETRVRQLIFLCDDLKGDNGDLKVQFDELSKSYKNLQEENKTLKIKYDNLKMAKIISTGQNDFKSAQSRLSKLVREVDKCIALLNE